MGGNWVISGRSLFESYREVRCEVECLADQNSTLLLAFLFRMGGATSYELERDFGNDPELLEDVLKKLRELRLIYSYSLDGTGERFIVSPKGLKVLEFLGISTLASWLVLERGANLFESGTSNLGRQELLIEALVKNYAQQNKSVGGIDSHAGE